MIVKGRYGYKFKIHCVDHGPIILVKFKMLEVGPGHGFEIPIMREHLREYLIKIHNFQSEPKERAIYN